MIGRTLGGPRRLNAGGLPRREAIYRRWGPKWGVTTAHHRDTLRAAREVAHAASYLASEAATLARLFESMGAVEASIAASEACIRAAQAAFELDERVLRESGGGDMADALVTASRSLVAASEAVESARRAMQAVAIAAQDGRGKA